MLIWGLIISPTQSCHTQVGFFCPSLKHKTLDIELIIVCDAIQDPFKIPQSSSKRTTSTSLWGQSSVIPTLFHGVPFLSAVLQSSLKPSNRYPLRHWAGLDLIPTQPTNAYVLYSPYQADDRKGALVVRLFESHGSTVTATLCTTLPVREAWRYLFLFLKFTAVCLYVEYSKNKSPPLPGVISWRDLIWASLHSSHHRESLWASCPSRLCPFSSSCDLIAPCIRVCSSKMQQKLVKCVWCFSFSLQMSCRL